MTVPGILSSCSELFVSGQMGEYKLWMVLFFFGLIESRVSTFESALQISSCLDFLYARIVEDEVDENATIPVIFEDTDESEKEESEDAMEADDEEKEDGEALDEASDGVVDFERIDDMSD